MEDEEYFLLVEQEENRMMYNEYVNHIIDLLEFMSYSLEYHDLRPFEVNTYTIDVMLDIFAGKSVRGYIPFYVDLSKECEYIRNNFINESDENLYMLWGPFKKTNGRDLG